MGVKRAINNALPLWDNTSIEQPKDFGGQWTEQKLDILQSYVAFYATALKNQKYDLIYIDAFAGTGHCNGNNGQIIGSALRSLQVEPGYQRYIFIERKPRRYKRLVKTLEQYPHKNIEHYCGDANELLPEILKAIDWRNSRAVLFLDPFGMELEWRVLEAIRQTSSVDLWYLFSLAGLFRQATRSSLKLTKHKIAALNRILGTNDWYEEIYKNGQQDFITDDHRVRSISVDQLMAIATKRFRDLFPYASDPLALPKTGVRRYALYFLTSNDSKLAISLASKVANHIVAKLG